MPNNQLNEVYTYLLGKRKVTGKGDFADKIGYHRTYVSDLLRGKKPVTQAVAQILFDKFSISTEWLLNNEGEMLFINEQSTHYAVNNNAADRAKAKQIRAAIGFLNEYADQLDGGEGINPPKLKAKKK